MTTDSGVALPMGSSAEEKLRPSGRVLDALTIVRMDRLADEMADGCPSISEAGRRIGVAQNRADQLWQRIRRQLGVQAA